MSGIIVLVGVAAWAYFLCRCMAASNATRGHRGRHLEETRCDYCGRMNPRCETNTVWGPKRAHFRCWRCEIEFMEGRGRPAL